MNSTALPLPNRSLCFQTSYIAFWRPAVCSSTALISSGTSPGPSPHCWRRQQRWRASDVRLGLMNPSSEEMVMMWWPQTSARKTSIANPLKQLMTACSMSRPRPSRAVIVDSRMPGLRAQNMWILTACPSLILTSTWGRQYLIQCHADSYRCVECLFAQFSKKK